MKLQQILLLFALVTLANAEMNMSIYCEHYKHGPSLDVRELVGLWMTVYTQPKNVNCFTMSIRATTELEREQLTMRYGNLSGRVDWSACYLQVEGAGGRHFLQGAGGDAGLLRNILIREDDKGQYELQEQSADQWTIFGRRGAELLLMRDCSGEALAIFVRAPYWPATTDLYAILHRSGIKPQASQRVICEPLEDCYSSVGSGRVRKKKGDL